MVLLPDSPAPERKPDFEFTQKHDINISDNFRLMKTTGAILVATGETLVMFSIRKTTELLH